MFLQVAALSLLSSLLAHCLNSGRVWLLALFLMNNTGLNHSAPCHGLWLVNAALTLAADWLLGWIIDGADIFADGWKWIIFHLGRSLSFFQVQLFEQRKETASEILSSAHLTWPPGENENKKSPSVKIFKTVGQTFSQSQFYNPGLGNPPQLSRVSHCHSLLTSQFADLNFVDSICSRPLCPCVWNRKVQHCGYDRSNKLLIESIMNNEQFVHSRCSSDARGSSWWWPHMMWTLNTDQWPHPVWPGVRSQPVQCCQLWHGNGPLMMLVTWDMMPALLSQLLTCYHYHDGCNGKL